MYHCLCHSCGEDELIDEFDEAQDYFNDHADQQCEVELVNVDVAENYSIDGLSQSETATSTDGHQPVD